VKIFFILTSIYLSISLYTQELYSYIDIGNMGVEFNTSKLDQVDYFYLTFPTYYIRESSTGLGLSIQSSELRVPFFSEDRFYFTLLETSLFWSPLDFKPSTIIGPFIDINLIPNKNHWFSARTGLRFVWVKSSFDVYRGSKDPKEMVLRNMDLEIGYSFLDMHFYISLSSDFSILLEGLSYINRDVIEEAFTF
jgi:hypothetical protein